MLQSYAKIFLIAVARKLDDTFCLHSWNLAIIKRNNVYYVLIRHLNLFWQQGEKTQPPSLIALSEWTNTHTMTMNDFLLCLYCGCSMINQVTLSVFMKTGWGKWLLSVLNLLNPQRITKRSIVTLDFTYLFLITGFLLSPSCYLNLSFVDPQECTLPSA